MKTHVFITGASSGIGKGIAEALLSDGVTVTGMQRRSGLSHPEYSHQELDLSSAAALEKFSFTAPHQAQRWVLINNAGTIGEVKPVQRLSANATEHSFFLNLTAPVILTQKFLQACEAQGKEPVVINISSGAASYPIPSWSTYCAAKAALEQFTQVLHTDHPKVAAMAISPGIVDTEMQDAIRDSKAADFPEHERFVNYKKQGELQSPQVVGKKIATFVHHPEKAPSVSFSLRDI